MQATAAAQGGGAPLMVAVGGERAALLGQVVGGTRECGIRTWPACSDAKRPHVCVQPGRGASSNGGAPSAYQLTSAIKECTSPDALLALVEQHGQAFNPINAATALTHAARLLAHTGCADIEPIVQLAREHLPHMQPRALANVVYALAKLRHKDDAFVNALLEAATPQLRDFNPQDVANTVWALATLGHADSAFVAALMKAAAPQLRDFTPQALANTVWALATLGHTNGAFVAALLKVATSQLRNFKPQELSNTAWALAKLQHYDGAFVVALLEVATPQLRNFKPQALANTVWALAALGHADSSFMAALLKAAALQLRNFNPQALANTAWALATLGYADDAFMTALLKAATPHLCDFKPQDLSNTVWALATLGHYDRAFMAALLKVATAQRRNFNPQAVSNTAWALAVLGHADSVFMATLLQQAAGMVLDLNAENLQQLFQCMLWLKDQNSGVAVPAQLAAACKTAWMEERDDPQPSRVQLEVLAVVRQLPGCSGATSEQATDDGLFSVDIAVQLPDGSRLAVEVDGPQHFLSSPPDRLDGATLLRNRLLEARGWRVVGVPVMTGWVPVAKQGQQAARDYLLNLVVGPL
ncbi:hypothetical protein FOA52_014889 [Chlamydomonas sp. UWO 241]|nr:hypothetical protein FOA52_014889 [Chlamydomonas sp. UWO 241]